MTKRFTLVFGIGALILLTTGCGNTFRGMGRDMEILGRRMQKDPNTSYPATPNTGYSQQDYNYYR